MSIEMRLVRQVFPDDGIKDRRAAVLSELERIGLSSRLRPGMRVAVAVGSRGISHYSEIVASLVSVIRAAGASAFIVPAMGSHAGGTAESQSQLLLAAGFVPERVGAPILSSMETAVLGRSPEGLAVHIDRNALAADALVVVNRVKAHTDFHAPVESGVAKMLVVGLGKREGAAEAHRSFYERGFFPSIKGAAEIIMSKVNFLCGLAIVENEGHEPIRIEAMRGDELFEREMELLALAKRRMARIPFRNIDLLVIDEIGKDISGSGMDLNVVGRKRFLRFAADDEYPKARFIYIRSLSADTHGNATGIGNADFVRDSLCDGIDFQATYTNCLTSGTPFGAAIPMRMKNDCETIAAARAAGNPDRFRLVRIRSTISLGEIWASEHALAELDPDMRVEVDKAHYVLGYAADGNFVEPVLRA
jgi:hypothetical protein